jgi:hypothetical protein
MAFNGVGQVFIWGSSSIGLILTRNNGQDFGAQWVMADPIVDESSPWGELTVSDFSKIKSPIYTVDFGGGGGGYAGSFVQYGFTVTNDQPYAQWFSVQGGGNT